jgi:toxin YoeB
MWKIKYTKQAAKDSIQLGQSNLKKKAEKLLAVITDNPYCQDPPYEKLSGDLKGAYSRRINVQHRLVYTVDKKNKIIMVVRMWTHYE